MSERGFFSDISNADAKPKRAFIISVLIVVVGAILLVVGIIVISVKNSRGDNIDEFNAAVRRYGSGQELVSNWLPASAEYTYYTSTANSDGTTTVTLANATAEFAATSTSITSFRGKKDGIDEANYYILNTNIDNNNDAVGDMQKISYTMKDVAPFSRDVIGSYQASAALPAYCPNSDGCTIEEMQRVCRSILSFMVYQPPSTIYETEAGSETFASPCTTDGNCGTCIPARFLADFCVVLAPATSSSSYKYEQSPRYRGCWWPFDESVSSQYYVAADPAKIVPRLQVRYEGDPFIVAQRVTEGTMNMGGYTRKVQNIIGGVCIGAGGFLLLVGIGIVVWAVRIIRKRAKEDASSTPYE